MADKRVLRKLDKAIAPTKAPPRKLTPKGQNRTAGPLRKPYVEPELIEEPSEERPVEVIKHGKAKEFVELEVTSSKGKRYKIVMPASYSRLVPRVWEWTIQRYRIAEMISEGIAIKQIADAENVHRNAIYAWLEHPEFREHVDGITMEHGFANKRGRIAGMNRLTQKLFDKVIAELSGIKLNEKSIGPVLTAIQAGIKHLAQEKEEFVEASKVDQTTNLSGTVAIAAVNLESSVQNLGEEERKKLEEEFNAMGDDIIRGITGGK